MAETREISLELEKALLIWRNSREPEKHREALPASQDQTASVELKAILAKRRAKEST